MKLLLLPVIALCTVLFSTNRAQAQTIFNNTSCSYEILVFQDVAPSCLSPFPTQIVTVGPSSFAALTRFPGSWVPTYRAHVLAQGGPYDSFQVG